VKKKLDFDEHCVRRNLGSCIDSRSGVYIGYNEFVLKGQPVLSSPGQLYVCYTLLLSILVAVLSYSDRIMLDIQAISHHCWPNCFI
jgi:hypothetical protein